MDWSLVLTSQGIDVTIDRSGETGAWVLLVPDEQSARARETLKRFREENRGWSVRVRMPGTDARLHWGALVWVFALVVVHGATAGVAPTTAVFDTAPFRSGEWWRAWTATWLHADLAHLVMNCIFGGLLMGLAMGRYGAGPALGVEKPQGALAVAAVAVALAPPLLALALPPPMRNELSSVSHTQTSAAVMKGQMRPEKPGPVQVGTGAQAAQALALFVA